MSGQNELVFDTVGRWSEIKLEIIRKYATAYSLILSKKSYIHCAYIDGFCGAGEHITKIDARTIEILSNVVDEGSIPHG